MKSNNLDQELKKKESELQQQMAAKNEVEEVSQEIVISDADFKGSGSAPICTTENALDCSWSEKVKFCLVARTNHHGTGMFSSQFPVRSVSKSFHLSTSVHFCAIFGTQAGLLNKWGVF